MTPHARGRLVRPVLLVAVLAAIVGFSIVGATALAGDSPRSANAVMSPADRSPFDPLSANEIATAVQVIEASKKFPDGAYFPIVTLNELPKAESAAWSPGQSFRREAFANVFDRAANRLFEAVVDLKTQKLVSWVERPNAEPAFFSSEYGDADAVVRAYAPWRKAMQNRGIKPDDVYLDVWAPGNVTTAGVPQGTRLGRAFSFFRGSLPNPYDRPIEGVVVTVDLNHLKVVDFTDTGIRPTNKTITGSSDTTRTGLKPLEVVQPNGPSFKIKGNAVEWQGWHFRVGYNPREGLVLYQIGYERDGVVRPIISRISQDEVYVPYAIPDPTWFGRAALDFGEYNLGQWIKPLEAKVDVPGNAVFFDEATSSDLGSAGDPTVNELDQVISMFEQNGGPLWSRTDPTSIENEGRFARELVVTATYPNGNYTYTTDYVFKMDGGIDVRAGSTGTTLNRGVNSVAEGDQFGSSVAKNIAAPNHQHFFNFRIDFDVDGTSNRLVEENTQSVPSSFGNAFVTNETVVGTEQFRDANAASDRRWVVESTTEKNAVGHPTAYELEPGDTAQPFSDPSYEPLRHAVFAQHALWVTRYRDGELSAVGDYPNQGAAGEGLPKYVSDHQSVDGKDLVVWYTTGLNHDTRVEDYPVMATEYVGFSLLPDGFFDENAALDAP